MAMLEVRGLCKSYPKFRLNDVSFSLENGRIMGFIGRNGAGKTTTLKSILHIVHPDAGEIRYFGMDFADHENEIKQKIGFAGGAVDFYKRRKVRDIISVTKKFYENWDEAAYRKYMDAFSLDEDKTLSQLSEGMKVKFSLVPALSHHAELLILDEPTSGLDPVSREELLEIFRYCAGEGVAILFSTHITSDIEKCADDISYIAKGNMVATGTLESFMAEHRAKGAGNSLDEIMVFCEKEDIHEKLNAKRV